MLFAVLFSIQMLLSFVSLAEAPPDAGQAETDVQATSADGDVPAGGTDTVESTQAVEPTEMPAETEIPVETGTPVPTDAAVTEAPTEVPTEAPAETEPAATGTPDPTEVPAATQPEAAETEAVETEPPAETEAPEPEGWTRTDDAPMDVREALEGIGISPASIVDGLAVSFTEDGESVDEPAQDALITLTFTLHIPEGVPGQIRADDWYVIERPETITATGEHTIMLTVDDVEYGIVEVENGPLRIKFTEAIEEFSTVDDSFAIEATFNEGAYAPGEEVTFALPGEEASGVSFRMADDAPDETSDETPDETTDEATGADDAGVVTPAVASSLSEQGLVTGFTAQFLDNGQITSTPTKDSSVAGTLTLTLSEAIAGQIDEGTVYSIALPEALSIPSTQTVDVTTGAGSLGTAVVDTDKTVALTFSGDAKNMAGESATLPFDAVLDPAVVTAGGAYTLTIPGETAAPSLPIVIYDSTTDPGNTWTRTDETDMDVKDIFDKLGISPATILTGMDLTYQEPGGGETSSTEASLDAAIDFNVSLHIPDIVTQNMRGGDTYTIQLPDGIKVTQGDTYDLVGTGADGNVSYGTVVVGTDGKVTITFKDSITTLANATGSFHFSASFDKDVINTPGDHEITIPNDSANISETVHIKSNVDQSIDKQGTPDKGYNPSQITWNVDFNKSMDTLHNAVISDKIPDGLSLAGTNVYTVDVDVNGNVIPGSEKPYTGAYTVDSDGTVRFTDPVNQAIRVEYVTDITGRSDAYEDMSFTNEATLSADEISNLTTSGTVTAHYGKLLDKKNIGYDPVTQTFTWYIRYNYGEQTISQSDATLTDTLSGPHMVFDQDSVVLHQVTIDENGNATVGGPITGGYSVTFDDQGKMVISFDHDVTEAIYITYTTKIDGIVDSSGVSYGNEVSTAWGDTVHDSSEVLGSKQENIVKEMNEADPVSQRVSWIITVNRSRYTMVNWSMTDEMGTGLHLVDPDQIVVQDISADPPVTLTPGTDYTVTVPEGQDQQFTVAFEGSYKAGTSDTFTILYYSHYDTDAPQVVTNTAAGSWTDTNGEEHGSSSTANYPRTTIDVDDGEKFGIYNAVTKQITWYVLANYHVNEVHPGQLIDPIEGDQEYVPGSLRFYIYEPGVPPEQGTQINPSEAGFVVDPPSAANNQTLTITYDGGEGSSVSVWGVFQTSLWGKVINEGDTYDNDAVLSVNGVDHQLHGEVTVAHGGELVDKSGTQAADGYVHWSATINGSQSTLMDVVLTDTPSENQYIDLDSIVIYYAKSDAAGNLITDTSRSLAKGTDYTVAYGPNDSGVWVLTIRFANTVNQAYVLQYRASVYLTSMTGTVTNNLQLDSSTNVDGNDTSDGSDLPVRVVEGGGIIYGETGSVIVRKTDAGGQLLPGAALVLKDKNNNVIGPVIVGASGEVTFKNIIQGNYTLYEIAAPDGYTISPALAAGMAVKVDDGTTSGDRVITIENDLTQVSFRKVDAYGQTLSGAEFRLDQYDTAKDAFVPYGSDTYTSGPDGMVWAYGLPAGRYQFVEISAPDGYVCNTDPVEVTLTADAQTGIIPPADGGDFVNYRASLTLVKVNGDNTPLTGAVFTLYDTNRNPLGEYSSDAKGVMTIRDLAPGAYLLVETRAPAGYELVSDPRRIDIPEAFAGPLVIEVGNLVNVPAQGAAILQKVDGDTGTGLNGAVFNVVNRDSGETVGQMVSGLDGYAEIRHLSAGNYTVEEVTAPDGYIINSKQMEFTITDDADGAAPFYIGTYENYHGRARLSKVDDDGAPLAGVTFTLYEDDDGKALGSYVTDADGTIELYLLEPGAYTLRETDAPIGFDLFPEAIHFTVPDAAEGEARTMRIASITNHRVLGTVVLHKVDDATNVSLAGAVYKLTRADTGETIAELTTDAEGIATYSGLEPGSYAFVEEKAPDGYAVVSTPLYFEITEETQHNLVEVTARDPRLPDASRPPSTEPTPPPSPRPTLSPDGPPKTGDSGNGAWGWIALGAGTLFLIALCIRIGWRRRDT